MMVLFPTILILKASVVPSTMESIYVVSVAWKPPLSAQSVMSIIVVVITRWLPGVSITKNIVEKETNLFLLYDDSKVYPRVQFPLWEVDIFPEPEPTKEELESEEAERKRLNAFKVAEGPVGRYLFVFFMCRYHWYGHS